MLKYFHRTVTKDSFSCAHSPFVVHVNIYLLRLNAEEMCVIKAILCEALYKPVAVRTVTVTVK